MRIEGSAGPRRRRERAWSDRRNVVAVAGIAVVFSVSVWAMIQVGDLEKILRGDRSDAAGVTESRITDRCDDRTPRFEPDELLVEGLKPRWPVVPVGRDAQGVPGTPPLTDAGKKAFGWDEVGVWPSEGKGNVFLDAHTWPDGSALGNLLLDRLRAGQQIRLVGESGNAACYRVSERLEVFAADPPVERVYRTDGPEGLVIVVCSGKRLGPGEWTKRTLWFAQAVTA